MPAVLAIPAFWGAVSAASIGTGAIVAAKMGANASNKGAEAQLTANRDTLQFQREQSAIDQQRAESTQRANYDQWAAREGRLSTLGELIGAGPRQIPAYVPIGQGGTGAPMPTTTGTSPAGTPSLASAQAAFDKLFPGSTLTPDMLKQNETALKSAGFTLRPNAAGIVGKIQYGNGPIIDVIQGAGSGVNRKQWLVGGPATGSTGSSPYLTSASSLLTQDLAPAVPDARRWTAASLMGQGYPS